MSTTSTARVDAFTAEVIRNAIISITDEMKRNLQRTSYSPIIYEAEDFTVGLFDADGETLSIGLGLPMFIGGLSDSIKAKLAFWGKDGIHPGDILLTNDPDVMGSHLNHMIFSLPGVQRRRADRVSPRRWRTGRTSAACSAASHATSTPKASSCRSSRSSSAVSRTRS